MTELHEEPSGSNIIPFVFEDQLVRIITREGEPWFVLADLCRVLNLANPSKVAADLDADEVNTLTISEGIRGNPEKNIVSESGLYSLVFKSRKPEAKQFRKWVTSEVLPTLRRTGRYEMPAEPRPIFEEDMPLQALSLKLSLVKEARLTFGVSASRRMWSAVGLPFAPAPHTEPMVEGAYEAIEGILNAITSSGQRVRILLLFAIDGQKEAAVALEKIGIRILDKEDGVVFSNTSSFLRKHGRVKSFEHPLALRRLPAARPWRREYFNCGQARCTFIPLPELEEVLMAQNGYVEDAAEAAA